MALGKKGTVVQIADPVGGYQMVEVPPDRPTMKQIAQMTGGKYFATADAKQLSAIYKGLGRGSASRRSAGS